MWNSALKNRGKAKSISAPVNIRQKPKYRDSKRHKSHYCEVSPVLAHDDNSNRQGDSVTKDLSSDKHIQKIIKDQHPRHMSVKGDISYMLKQLSKQRQAQPDADFWHASMRHVDQIELLPSDEEFVTMNDISPAEF